MRLFPLATLLTACSFPRGDAGGPLDAPPVACADLDCDPNATCVEDATGATCVCASGYAGDGTTCGAIDPCATDNGGCAAGCEMTGPGMHVCYAARTCAEVAMHQQLPDDTEVTLYVDGDASKPWSAFCHAMAEYLTPTTPTSNFGQYTAGNKSPGTNVRTSYARLRIDPTSFAVDICDTTFATSTGALSHDPAFHDPDIAVTSMPLGIAMDCGGSNSQSGAAGISLAGTPFVVASNWSRNGNGNAGAATKMMNGRAVSITGGGSCGWNAPSGAPNDPFNACTSLKLIALQYLP